MKTKILIMLLFSQLAFSQIWVDNYNDAIKVAKASNKLVFLDFNAHWCGPCQVMEKEFLKDPKYKDLLDKFVMVSINIDANKDLASQYGVKSIPNVKLVNTHGEVIHEVLGYESAGKMATTFEGFPDTVGDLYSNLDVSDPKNPTDEELMGIATSYQVLIQKSNGDAKQDFFTLSNNYLSKCAKKTSNTNLKELADLGKYFNMALLENNKKVIKQLDVNKVSSENKSFAYYILAKANYQEKQLDDGNLAVTEILKINNPQWTHAAEVLKDKYASK